MTVYGFHTFEKSSIPEKPILFVHVIFDLEMGFYQILGVGAKPTAYSCQSTDHHGFDNGEIPMFSFETQKLEFLVTGKLPCIGWYLPVDSGHHALKQSSEPLLLNDLMQAVFGGFEFMRVIILHDTLDQLHRADHKRIDEPCKCPVLYSIEHA